ncbi:TrbC/VirB2 family protein [Frateuria sp. MAH-13]|uniref:TrbC/VirB2 family protein n=1 Tax=Frateuria flava TaxID=2821489 RepID=A0ABS4DRT6_9GAMM|nr:TrbC/VirB2 family protein [Frateuria flava]
MAKNLNANPNARNPIRSGTAVFMAMAMCLTLALPGIAFGQDVTDTIATTCGFASNVNKILNAISIIVVTIAIVFSGYQIAFAHKRISDISPVLIGAVLIGAAGQIAKMFLAGSTSASGATACTASLVAHVLNFYA